MYFFNIKAIIDYTIICNGDNYGEESGLIDYYLLLCISSCVNLIAYNEPNIVYGYSRRILKPLESQLILLKNWKQTFCKGERALKCVTKLYFKLLEFWSVLIMFDLYENLFSWKF